MEAWIQQVRARGLAGPLRLLLDVLEPLGPLGAQLLWAAQPVSGLFGAAQPVQQMAEMLEQPDGIEQLRRLLDD
jgi:hypothetical protein